MNDEQFQNPPIPRRLCAVVHLHDPGFLADEEVARLCAAPLASLADLLLKHPGLRLGLHLPGRVLDAAGRAAPRALEALRQATVAERLEWLGGGYHDPILLLTPDSWRRTQIQMLRQALRNHMAVEPRGAWLPEFVWDPNLIPGLVQAGFQYSVLKDWQIDPAMQPGQPSRGGWHITDEMGVPFRLLAAQDGLAALFRAGAVEEMLQLAIEGGGTGVVDIPLLAPSRQGFEPVHLERLSALAGLCGASSDSWRFALPSEILRSNRFLSATCVAPSASRNFCPPGPGGGVRDLLRREAAANSFHKRLLHLCNRADETASPKVRALASDPLLRAQNAAFLRDSDEAGGVRFLRDRVRMGELLLEARSILDDGDGGDSVRLDALDLLCDGHQQLVARHPKLGIFVEPAMGGCITGLDHPPKRHPWGALSAGVPVLEEFFTDVLEPEPGTPLPSVGDFARASFESQLKRTGKDLQILLSRTGIVSLEERQHAVTLEKTFTLRAGKPELVVTYKIGNPGTHLLLFGFGCRVSASPREPESKGQRHRLGGGEWTEFVKPLAAAQCLAWDVEDGRSGASLSWDVAKPARMEVRPLMRPWPRSPEAERFDGLQAVATWEVRLAPGESWSLITRFRLGTVRKA
jgi:hypothetical protein